MSSITFEPLVSLVLPNERKLSFYAAIDRPLDAHENFAVPSSYIRLIQAFQWLEDYDTELRFYVTGLNLHRWTDDGHMIRNSLEFQISKDLGKGFSAYFRGGPYFQLNKYTQTTSGKDQTKYGFSERVGLGYSYKRLTLDLLLVVGQRFTVNWKNDYTTVEQLTYKFSDSFSLGIAHEILSSLVDATTGRYRPVRLFDGRDSRISTFVELSL